MEPSDCKTPGLDDADRIWDLLTECLDCFVRAWESSAQPPRLIDFAPPHPPEARQLALVELVKLDLEYRWDRGVEPLRLEDYVDRLPELAAGAGLSADLLYEEYLVRRRAGEEVEAEEYFDRFPDQCDQLRRLLGLAAPEVSSGLLSAKRPTGLQAGDQLDDFHLLAELGSGAFAAVFLARQRSMQRIVALKVSANQGSEPQTLAQLDHPHIVRVYDQRVLPDRDWRLLYMKYVAGGTLKEAIEWSTHVAPQARSGQTLLDAVDDALLRRAEEPPRESTARATLAGCDWATTVCRIGIQLADALAYAHQRGVLHRDLKPANVLLSGEASPQLVDFNISFCSKLDGATPAAYFGGSLAYMSPEQLEACSPKHQRTPDSLDGRSDIYALGVVLWEMLAGQRPFRDEQLAGGWTQTLDQMLQRRLQGPRAAELDQLPFTVPEPLKQVLLKCLAAEPPGRYASAADLSRELRLCLQPRAYRLLRPPAGSWIHAARRYSLLALVVIALLPNALAAWFNFVYNRDHIVARLQDSQQIFWNLQAAINAVAFPAGIALMVILCLPVLRGVPPQDKPADEVAGHMARRRARCLKLGQYTALICIAEWVVAGFIYPLAMEIGGVRLDWLDYLHFISSLALCGIIAATYPFFGVTAFAVHSLYPSLLRGGDNLLAETDQLRWVERKVWFYLALGLLLPMFAVVLLVTLGSERHRTALLALSIASFVGCGLIFWLARAIQTDLATLRELIADISKPS